MSAGSGASARHWVVGTVVIAGHLGAWFLLTHCRSIRGSESADLALQVILIPQLERPEPPGAVNARPSPRHSRRPVSRVPPEAESPRTSDERANAITDWDAAARGAAADVLGRERRKLRERPFEHAFPEHPPPEEPGVFGSYKENHRAGRIDDGQRFWVSDNCYFDAPRGPPPPPMVGEVQKPPVPTCKPPPTGGGGRMFDALTPDYLKKLPAPGGSQ